MADKIRIGSRKSKLALWQAEEVQRLLGMKGVDSEIVAIETKGDKILNVSIAKIGSKGVFTEELEDQLRRSEIDIAVHSAKDMQSVLPEDLEIIAFTKREYPGDVIIGGTEFPQLDSENSITIGRHQLEGKQCSTDISRTCKQLISGEIFKNDWKK